MPVPFRKAPLAAAVSAALFVVPTQAPAVPVVALGDEFEVPDDPDNTNQSLPDVASDDDGNFVVVWDAGTDIAAQRFNADGTRAGGEFTVNSDATTDDRRQPRVAMDADGDFAVAWFEYAAGGGYEDVVYRVFQADGTPVTSDQNAAVSVLQAGGSGKQIDVAMDQDGDFVVAWAQYDTDFASDIPVYRPIQANGVPLTGSSSPASTDPAGIVPAVDMADDGSFVITWMNFNQAPDSDSFGVFARRFGPTGSPLDANEFLVNTTTASNQRWPDVAVEPTGDFVIAWHAADGFVDFQRFAADGTTAGGETRANVNDPVSFPFPQIGIADGGDFAIAWEGADGGESGIFARAFAADGTPDTDDLSVTQDVNPPERTAEIAMDADGEFVVAWEQYLTPGTYDDEVFARQFVNGPPTADAGPDQTVLSGASVTLDASGSSDPENDIASFSWTQTGGTAVTLSDPSAQSPSFTAPDSADTLTFEVTVIDGEGQTDTDAVTITVQGQQQPLIEGSSSGTGSLGWLGALGLGLAALGRRVFGRRRKGAGGGAASLLAGALALGAVAGAPDVRAADELERAGAVESATGTVTASRDAESRRSLSAGDPVYVGDRVRTGVDASAVLRLADGTRVDLRADSEFRVADVERGGGDGGGLSGMFMDLLRGGLRLVTGSVADRDADRYRLRTPVATIGVRGTEFEARVCRRPGECPAADEVEDEGPEPAARVLELRGVVEATGDNGATRVVDAGDGVYPGDTVVTGDDAWAVLQFADESKVSLQPGSRFRVDEWEFERDDPDAGNALFNLLRGGMRVLTGLIGDENGDNYRVSTPVATIGVRGTGFDLVCVGSCVNAEATLGAVEGDGLFIHTWDGTAFAELEGSVAEFAAGEAGFIANPVLPAVRLQSLPPALQNLSAPRPDQVLGQLPDGAERLYTQVEDGAITVQGATGDAVVVTAGSAAVVGAGGAATSVAPVGAAGLPGLGAGTVSAAFSALIARQFDLATFYGGASTGRSGLDSDDDFENRIQRDFPGASVSSLSNAGIGARAFGGVRMLEVLAFEVGYVDLGEFNSRIDPGGEDESAVGEAAVGEHPLAASGFDFSALVRTPVNINTWAFARAGVFVWEADVETTTPSGESFSDSFDGTDAIVGGGVEHKIGPGLWARAEWIHYRLDPDQVNFVGGGLVWTFP